MPVVVPVAPFTFLVAAYRRITKREPPTFVKKLAEPEEKVIKTIEEALPRPPGGFPRIEFKEYKKGEFKSLLPRIVRR